MLQMYISIPNYYCNVQYSNMPFTSCRIILKKGGGLFIRRKIFLFFSGYSMLKGGSRTGYPDCTAYDIFLILAYVSYFAQCQVFGALH